MKLGVSGAWKEAKEIAYGLNSTWKQVKELRYGIAGVWEKVWVFAAELLSIITEFLGVTEGVNIGGNGVALVKDADITDLYDCNDISNNEYTSISGDVTFQKNAKLVGMKYKTNISGEYQLIVKNMQGNNVCQPILVNGAGAGEWILFVLPEPMDVVASAKYNFEIVRPKSKSYMKKGSYTGTYWSCDKLRFGTTEFVHMVAMGFVFAGTYNANGTYTNPELDLSPAVQVQASEISWDKTTPDDTNITVQTSLSTDGGIAYGNWQTATNGGVIPGLTQGQNLEGVRLKWRALLSTNDGYATPILHEVAIKINEAI